MTLSVTAGRRTHLVRDMYPVIEYRETPFFQHVTV
jgi:hypothetical protein